MDYEQLRSASHETMMAQHLGRLDVSDIADFYTLGYMLQKAEELELPVVNHVYHETSSKFDFKVREVTLAGVCTLGRELLGNGFSVGAEDISEDEDVKELAKKLSTEPNPYFNEVSIGLYEDKEYCAAKSIKCPNAIGATLSGLRIAALEALQSGDLSQAAEIASMTGSISATLFEAIGRCDWSNSYTSSENPIGRAIAKVGNWTNFARLVQQAGSELYVDSNYGSKFTTVDQIIHAQHGGSLTKASMLDRSAVHPSQAKQLLDSKEFATSYSIELAASQEVKELAKLAPELSPFTEDKTGILDSSELAEISGKVKGLNVLKLLGYKVPFYVNFRNDDPTWWSKELIKSYGYGDSTKWAVRSSANLEDSHNFSFAGIFQTVLDVSTEELDNAADTVRNSKNKPKVEAYCAMHGIDPVDLEIEHIIQEFKEPVWSGVWIGNSNGGTLEWVEGRGEKLVNGSATPYREVYGQEPALFDEEGRSVSDICREIEARVGSSLDLEFAMTEDGLQWVQMRPVTVARGPEMSILRGLDKPFEGYGISGGIARGLSYRLVDPNLDTGIDSNDEVVFVGEDARDDRWMQIHNLAGIITRKGGALSHAAIISREMGIPFVAGIDIDQVPEGIMVEVNGNTGAINTDLGSRFTLRALIGRLKHRAS